MTRHGADNATDRATGQHWETQFCRMARQYGKVFTPHQFKHAGSPMFYGSGGQWTLPDITIWSAPGEHHELKHKRPTRDGEYGLERYRLSALIRFANTTGQRVLYTIHDWEIAGAVDSRERCGNQLDHWFTADVDHLFRGATDIRTSPTYYNGGDGEHLVETWYWTASRHFTPLADLWRINSEAA